MRIRGFRFAVSGCAAAALLWGCGGSQSFGTAGATPQRVIYSTHAMNNARSWMEPAAKNEDLLYVSVANNEVEVFSYPAGQLVGTLTGFDDPLGLCSDAKGNVWITNGDNYGGNGSLVEYAHGATAPTATLQDTGNAPQACSIDPTTGNLAVADIAISNGVIPNIAVYPKASGSPTYYSTEQFVSEVRNITYDGSGNVYFGSDTRYPAWLPKGSSSVMKFKLNPLRHGSLQWDGAHLAVLTPQTKADTDVVIRYTISGASGKYFDALALDGLGHYYSPLWIHGSGMVTSDLHSNVYFYDYPQGGSPTHTISGLAFPVGVTISVNN